MRKPPVAALVFALVASAVTLVLLLRGKGEDLTEDALAEAAMHWEKSGPKDYDLIVVVNGDEQRISVRGWKVVSMTTGGAPVPPHAWEHWTVDGMFGVLRVEWQRKCEQNQDSVLRADFDPDYGYPRYFLRHVMGEPTSTEWRVTEFHEK